MPRKNIFQKTINRKIGGIKRSAKVNLKKESKNQGCLVKSLSIFGLLILIIIIASLYLDKKTPTKVEVKMVESEGLEPSSKQTIKLLSTCLFFI